MAILNIDRNLYPAPISVKLQGAGDKVVNGSFINYTKGKDEHNFELFCGKKLDGKSPMVAFVCEPFHPYRDLEEERDQLFKDGDVVRAEPLAPGKEITVSIDDCIDGAIKAGELLTIKANSTKLTKDADGTAPFAIALELVNILDQKSVRLRFL